jgi:hypothetical protein
VADPAMTLSDQLRQAIESSPKAVYRIAKDSDVPYGVLSRFVSGESPDIPISTADKLAAYLKLRLVGGNLSDKPATSPRKEPERSTPALKGTKLAKNVLAQLSGIMEFGDGNLSLEEFLQAQLKKDIDAFLANMASDSEYAHLSASERKTFCRFFHILDLPNGWLSRGVARRLMLNAPEELRKFLSMRSRLEYLWNKAVHNAGSELDSPYILVWPVLQALAARDHEAARAYLNLGIAPLKKGHRDAVVISNAVYAILSGDAKMLAAAAIDLKPKKASNQWFAGCFMALAGMIQRSAELVAEGLANTLNSRSIWVQHYEKVICLEAHGLVELARTVSPKLISTFDLNRPLPWDKEFYASTLSAKSPLDGANLKMLPSDTRAAILQLKVPKWLRFSKADA